MLAFKHDNIVCKFFKKHKQEPRNKHKDVKSGDPIYKEKIFYYKSKLHNFPEEIQAGKLSIHITQHQGSLSSLEKKLSL